MSEQKHTPGPWFTNQEHGTIYVEASLRPRINQEIAACGPTEAREQQEANARLIAAAPEMFDWLEKVVRSDGAMITRELVAIQALLDKVAGTTV